MRKLFFTTLLNVPSDQIWPRLEDINNYPAYIKFCHKAELNGPFVSGSTWYDWSSVVIIPLKITHEIISVVPKKEIIYRIKLPSNGELWQKLILNTEEGKTRVSLEVTIEFGSKILDIIIGPLIYYRNKVMLEATLNNIKQAVKNENS